MVEPWDKERRSRTKRKIDREAERVAARIGASHVAVIAFFPAGDGQHMHMLDGGSAPMDFHDLYRHMVANMDKLEASGGEDIAIQ